MDIDTFKAHLCGQPTYRLKHSNVYVSREGWHVTAYLDPVDSIHPAIDRSMLSPQKIEYIEQQLQCNESRFSGQVNILKKHIDFAEKNVLDIGCGGGLFLRLVRKLGAKVKGIELSDSRAAYAMIKNNIDVVKRPVEDKWWQHKTGQYDLISLWDVIEHVNYPLVTLKSAISLIKTGGYLAIDTPCRDSFYHRFGVLTYKLSFGKFPTLLNSIYSDHLYGHKQIFSVSEMRNICTGLGLEIVEFKKIHELSFPYEFYLEKLTGSQRSAKALVPLVNLFFHLFHIQNKMLIIAKKKKQTA